MQVKHIIKSILPHHLLTKIQRYRYTKAIERFTQKNDSEFEIMRCLIHRDDYVLDLGANFGWYSKFFSNIVGDKGTVFCVEPVPSSFEMLSHVVKKLKLNNVKPYHYAISNKDGMTTMSIPVYSGSNVENHFEARIVDSDSNFLEKKITVKTKTIDSLFGNFNEKISFIKCDVEGHELSCLQGAFKILTDSKPAWLLEIWGDPDKLGSQAQQTFFLLEGFGYKIYFLNGGRLKRRLTGEKSSNFDYFFLHEKHIQELKKTDYLKTLESIRY